MKQRAATWALMLVLLGWVGGAVGETLDRIVAVVNDEVVLASELEDELSEVRQQLSQRDMPMPPAGELRRQVLERLVVQTLQLNLADRMGITVDDASLDAAVRRVAQQNNLSLPEFRDALTNTGMTMAGYRERLREDITLSRLHQRVMQQRVNVTPQEIDQFLAQSADDRTEYRLSHILVAAPEGASPADLDAARQEARNLRQRLAEGANFATLATTASDSRTALEGGDIGWRTAGELPRMLTERLPDMEPGDITEVLRTPAGFHLFRLDERRQGERRIVTQTKARHILIRTDEVVTDADARQRLASLRQRIRNGASFAELARANSDDPGSASRGGDLGWIEPGSMVPAMEQRLTELEPGELSQPFESRFGWHLVEVLDRRQQDTTEEVRRRRALQQIRQRKEEQEMELWLRQLRDEAYVDYRLSA